MEKEISIGKRGMAMSQIAVLLMGAFAIAYALGSQIGFVSAATCTSSSQYSFQYGSHTYCVTAASSGGIDQVMDDRGYVYTKGADGNWYWHDGSSNQVLLQDVQSKGATGPCTGNSGSNCANPSDAQTQFSSAAKGAISAFLSAQTTTSSSSSCLAGHPMGEKNVGGLTFYASGSSVANHVNLDSDTCVTSDTTSAEGVETILTNKGDQIIYDANTGKVSLYNTNTDSWSYYSTSSSSQTQAQSSTAPSSTPAPTAANDLSSIASVLGISSSKVYSLYQSCVKNQGSGTQNQIIQCVINSAKDLKNGVSKPGSKTTKTAPQSSLLGVTSLLKYIGVGSGWATFLGNIVEGAAIATAIYYGGDMLLTMFGLSGNKYAEAAKTALAWGWFAGQTTYGILAGAPASAGISAGLTAGLTLGIGIGVTAIVFFTARSSHQTEAVIFTCIPWQAQTGSSVNCEACGKNGLGCTQYECQSLGQECQLLNKGDAGKQVCANVGANNVSPPVMTFIKGSLPNSTYTTTTAQNLKAGSRATGVKILFNGGAMPAYTPLSFGIHTDIPSRCKMDILNENNYSNMGFTLDSGLFEYNHTVSLSVPSVNSTNMATIAPNGQMNVFVRCQGANNVTDISSFVVQFNVQAGKDVQPPVIEGTNVGDTVPVYAGIDNTSIVIYTNEPVSGCGWSHSDQGYTDMINTSANKLTCSNVMNPSNGYYACSASLTGIKDSQKNIFYFRCNDTSGNVDQSSFSLDLIGTQPLIITSVTPNNTIVTNSTYSVPVTITAKTAAGYNKGQATCYYKLNGTGNGAYSRFTSTNSYVSTASLWLNGGNNTVDDYTYNIKCVDLGGNADFKNITFGVKTDKNPPQVQRVYQENNQLEIITNENATCVYDVTDCTYPFSSGIAMTDVSGTIHTAPWMTSRTYYIKCEDQFGNKPLPQNTCSAVIRPSTS